MMGLRYIDTYHFELFCFGCFYLFLQFWCYYLCSKLLIHDGFNCDYWFYLIDLLLITRFVNIVDVLLYI